jgi:hypothetical protein
MKTKDKDKHKGDEGRMGVVLEIPDWVVMAMFALAILSPILIPRFPTETRLALDILLLIGLFFVTIILGTAIGGLTIQTLFGDNIIKQLFDEEGIRASFPHFNHPCLFFLAFSGYLITVSVILDQLIVRNIFDTLGMNFKISLHVLGDYYFSLFVLLTICSFKIIVLDGYILKNKISQASKKEP